ncbi:uncharacterized protein LOC144105044 [Amblyomma americanum]
MDLLKVPEPLRLSGNLSENWQRFKQKFELYLQATTVEKAPKSDASKAAHLLSFAGDEALDIFNNFQYGPGESKESYGTVVQKFGAYFSEVSNKIHERYVFCTRSQMEKEHFEKFGRDLKRQATQCNFGDQHDSLIRDQIVFGTNNSKLRERMLAEKDLTLLKAEELCKAAELAALRSQVWNKSEDCVDSISSRTVSTKKQQQRDKKLCLDNQEYCYRKCNRKQRPKQCPAFGKISHSSRKFNHFASCCRKSTTVSEVGKVDEND